MINFDDVTKENIKKHKQNWPQIPDHPYRTLIIEGSGAEKINSLFNLISQQPDIDKIHLCAKDLCKAKYQILISKRKSTGLKHLNDSKLFVEYSNDMDNTCKNMEERNPYKKHKILIVFDNMIADMLSKRKLNPIVTEWFIRGRKLNISLVFITQSYFAVPKNVGLNSMHYFIIKIPNKQKRQRTAFNYSSDIDFKDFMNRYKKYTVKPYSFLLIDTTLTADNVSHFRKNHLERM